VLGLRRPLSYSDIAERLKEMVKFRNFLVHKYPFVQKEKLIETAKHDLKSVKEFIKIILNFLKKFF
jgi:uncharacterized protein YutE (UPF0331/DUF86 family)